MCAQPKLCRAHLRFPFGTKAKQVGENNQPTVRPASTLNYQRAEIRWRRTVGQPLRMVEQSPPFSREVDRRPGILNHCLVLDIDANIASLPVIDHADVLQRLKSQQRIRADPKRRIKGGEALMDKVLYICRRASYTLKRAGSARTRRIGRLRDRELWI